MHNLEEKGILTTHSSLSHTDEYQIEILPVPNLPYLQCSRYVSSNNLSLYWTSGNGISRNRNRAGWPKCSTNLWGFQPPTEVQRQNYIHFILNKKCTKSAKIAGHSMWITHIKVLFAYSWKIPVKRRGLSNSDGESLNKTLVITINGKIHQNWQSSVSNKGTCSSKINIHKKASMIY